MSATASAIVGLLARPDFKLCGHYSRSSASLNQDSALKARLVLALYAFESCAEAPRKRRPCTSASQSAVSDPTRLSVPFEAMSGALSQAKSRTVTGTHNLTTAGGVESGKSAGKRRCETEPLRPGCRNSLNYTTEAAQSHSALILT